MAKAKTAKVSKKSKKPKKKALKKSPAAGSGDLMQPWVELRHQMEDMFDRYFRGWPVGWPRLGHGWGMEPSLELKGLVGTPTVDMSETDKAYEITAELPGMDEKDLDVNVTDDVLTISGEKKDERKEEKKGYYVQERRYGQFRRSLRLPQDADVEKISARFDKGVLRVEVPRTGDAAKRGRKVNVN